LCPLFGPFPGLFPELLSHFSPDRATRLEHIPEKSRHLQGTPGNRVEHTTPQAKWSFPHPTPPVVSSISMFDLQGYDFNILQHLQLCDLMIVLDYDEIGRIQAPCIHPIPGEKSKKGYNSGCGSFDIYL